MAKKPNYKPTSKAVVPNPGRTFGTLKHGAQNQQAGATKAKTT
jgi:hypothetical protein